MIKKIKKEISLTNPNDCNKCQWRNTPISGWCRWWYTEPAVKCLYDKG